MIVFFLMTDLGLWKIPKKLGMISLQRRCKKHRQNHVFLIRGGLTLEQINLKVLFYGTSGEGFYTLWSFTGQQLLPIIHSNNLYGKQQERKSLDIDTRLFESI